MGKIHELMRGLRTFALFLLLLDLSLLVLDRSCSDGGNTYINMGKYMG